MSKVTFIIVTFNGEKHIEKCVKSIRAFCPSNYLIVVDNNSEDNTKKILQNLRVDDLVLSATNLGFGKANNLGLRKALALDSEYVFLANQDIYFHSGDFESFLRRSKQAFNEESFGVISPIHLAPNEHDFDLKFAQYASEKNTPGLIRDLEQDNGLIDNVYQSKAINAAAWLMSKKCIEKAGVFDPLFPHYGEDTDFIRRLQYHNIKIGVLPNIKIVHNRLQKDSTLENKAYYRLKIWVLTYMKDINKSLSYRLLRLPFELIRRLKNSNINSFKAVVIFFQTLFFIVGKCPIMISHRSQSKRIGAFIK